MEQPSERPKTMGRGVRIALFVSLAFNLLILGLVGGAVFDNRGNIGPRADLGPAMEAGMVPFGQAMTKPQRREFVGELEKRNGDLRANRGRVREQMATLIGAISAVPFDPDALEQAFFLAQQTLGERQRISAEVLVERIAAMSDDERAAFVERLEKSLRRVRQDGRR